MRSVLLIALKDLRQRIRDRSVLVFAIIAPAGLAAIFSLVLGGVTDFHARYAVVDLDGGPLAAVLREDVLGSLVDAGVVEIDDVASADAARTAVLDEQVDAAIVIPAGFSDAITGGASTDLLILGTANTGLATQIANSIATQFGDQVRAIQLAVHTTGAVRGTALGPAEVGAVAAAAQALPAPIEVVDDQAALRQLSATTYFSAAMAILFLFFAAQYGILSLHTERRSGTLDRILAGPVRPWQVLLGKALSGFATGLLAMTVLVVGTTLALGAEWGHPVGVGLIVIAAIVAAIGITTLVISFTRSEDGAGSAVAAVAISLGILGGTFSPAARAPELMSQLSLITPHAWFLRGLGDLHGTDAAVTDALPSVAVLLAMGIVFGAVGFARARRLVTAR
jgi:ABC-2 type transport system permease protein